MKALSFYAFGNSDILEYKDIPTPILNNDEILVEMKAIGLNFSDVYRRKGNYHLVGNPPFIAGDQGAGVVLNTNNTGFKIGDRVAFADVPLANAELVAVPILKVIPLPATISFKTAATILLQG
jgi:NADPH2:quinone reductase